MTRCIWPGGRPSLCITSRSTGKASEAIRPSASSAWCRRRSSVRKVSWNHGAWHVAGIVNHCNMLMSKMTRTKHDKTPNDFGVKSPARRAPGSRGPSPSATETPKSCHRGCTFGDLVPFRVAEDYQSQGLPGIHNPPKNAMKFQDSHGRKHLEVSYNFGNPKSSKSLDHFRWFEDIEAHGDLGIPHFKNPPLWRAYICCSARLLRCAHLRGAKESAVSMCLGTRVLQEENSKQEIIDLWWFVYGNHRNPSGFRIKTTKRGTATHGSRGSPFHWAGATEVGRAREDVHPPRHPPKLGLSRWDHLAPARSMSIFDVFLSLMYKICTYLYIYY